ncbi:hypothetical protein V1511DRAFT_492453 [Dipodascopsis uninucleata]
MSIVQLNKRTVQALSSAQVIISPESIVRELVDNAIDAGARNINIEIDASTVDSILIRDDGCGVSAGENRDLMCRHHTTSKISSFEDLRSVIHTKGFRGEALASLVEIAGRVEITSRTAEDQDGGEYWMVAPNGKREQIRRISASRGTVVSTATLFERLPVRRQLFAKTARKTINAIRNMLLSYSLAHYNIRFNFRIIRSVTAPILYGGVRSLKEAIVGAIGRSVLSDSIVIDEKLADGWRIEAILPQASDEETKDFKQAIFAVDHRVLNGQLYTARKLLKLAKEHVRSSHRTLLFCHIHTPKTTAIYDINIEPGKDDILFFSEEYLEKWAFILKSIYYTDSDSESSPQPQDDILILDGPITIKDSGTEGTVSPRQDENIDQVMYKKDEGLEDNAEESEISFREVTPELSSAFDPHEDRAREETSILDIEYPYTPQPSIDQVTSTFINKSLLLEEDDKENYLRFDPVVPRDETTLFTSERKSMMSSIPNESAVILHNDQSRVIKYSHNKETNSSPELTKQRELGMKTAGIRYAEVSDIPFRFRQNTVKQTLLAPIAPTVLQSASNAALGSLSFLQEDEQVHTLSINVNTEQLGSFIESFKPEWEPLWNSTDSTGTSLYEKSYKDALVKLASKGGDCGSLLFDIGNCHLTSTKSGWLVLE